MGRAAGKKCAHLCMMLLADTHEDILCQQIHLFVRRRPEKDIDLLFEGSVHNRMARICRVWSTKFRKDKVEISPAAGAGAIAMDGDILPT